MAEHFRAELYPEPRAPYYIATLPFTRFSAGVKVLHLLCHSLNLRGQRAYLLPIYPTNARERESFCEPSLVTPLLTRRTTKRHADDGLCPIIVYPEIVTGNPFSASCVVRYVLNFPGALGGDVLFNADELCFSYSKVLAAETKHPENILFIPASDTRIFYPPPEQEERRGTCFYASKYQNTHKGQLLEITNDSLEITSGRPNSQSPEQVADIFRKCEIFYTYENTALAVEATLCGCPTVFLPNPYLKSIIASEELGGDGFAWGNSDAEVSRARDSVKNAFNNYMRTIDQFYAQLDLFVSKTQENAKTRKYALETIETLLAHLPKMEDDEWREEHYAPLFRKFPWKIEKRIGEFLNSLGLEQDGGFLWDRATKRGKK